MSEPVTRENPPLEEDDKNSVDELDDTPTADSAEAGTSSLHHSPIVLPSPNDTSIFPNSCASQPHFSTYLISRPQPLGTSAVPAKRGRGRPKGSKNKKTLGIAAPAVPAVPKKRGRPPKVRHYHRRAR